MANPIFVSITSDGGVWASITKSFVPAGKTVVATAQINSGLASQQIHAVTANDGLGHNATTFASTASSNKYGSEIA